MTAHFHTPFAGRRRSLAALLGAAAALVLFVAPVSATPPGWSNPRQVLSLRGGPNEAMAIDSRGYVHIVADGGGFVSGLTYISNEPADGETTPSWFSIPLTNKADRNPSISIYHDRVYIAFERLDPNSLHSKGIWTATNASGTFVIAKRHGGTDNDPSVSAAGGHWHISFQQGGSLKYMSDVGGWSPETIDATCCAGPSSLAVTGSGQVRVAYPDGSAITPTSLRYASRSASGAWSFTTIDAHQTRFVSLVLVAGVPYVAYNRQGTGTFWAFRSGAAWPRQLISSDDGPPDIAATSGGHLAVVSINPLARVRYAVVGNGPISSRLLTTRGNFSPQVAFHNGAKVTFSHDEGATPVDGVWFMKQN